jgi:hypothetical protein
MAKGDLVLRSSVLVAAFSLFVAADSMADPPSPPPPRLSDDARKFMSYCNKQMERDYEGEVLIRGHAQSFPDGTDLSDQQAVKHIISKRGLVAKKFFRDILVPHSRKRLIAYVGKYSPDEIRKLNELMPLRRRSEGEGKRVLAIQEDLEKIEDEVLKEVPDSRFPKFN